MLCARVLPVLCVCVCVCVGAECQSALPASQGTIFSMSSFVLGGKNTEQSLLCKLKNTKEKHFYFTELCTPTRHREGHKQYIQKKATPPAYKRGALHRTSCGIWLPAAENVICERIIVLSVNTLHRYLPLRKIIAATCDGRFSRTWRWCRMHPSAQEGWIL